MREHPATIRAFIEARMNCVGCPIGGFHTIDDACREHGVDRERFLKALREMAMAAMAASPV
jgi:hybrid cluster-associated redox disulfide protein